MVKGSPTHHQPCAASAPLVEKRKRASCASGLRSSRGFEKRAHDGERNVPCNCVGKEAMRPGQSKLGPLHSEEDVLAVLESAKNGRKPPPHLAEFHVVDVGYRDKPMVPQYEFEDGFYVLLRTATITFAGLRSRITIPAYLRPRVITPSKRFHWKVQSQRKRVGSVRVRSICPRGRFLESNKRGRLYSELDSSGTEKLDYRLLHIFSVEDSTSSANSKRASTETNGSSPDDRKRARSDDSSDSGGCAVCGENDDQERILICDGCESEWHTYCCKPKVSSVPDGDWFCEDCVEKRGKKPKEDPECLACGKHDPQSDMLVCDDCERRCHMACCDPPLHRRPRERWFCEHCVDDNKMPARKNDGESNKRDEANNSTSRSRQAVVRPETSSSSRSSQPVARTSSRSESGASQQRPPAVARAPMNAQGQRPRLPSVSSETSSEREEASSSGVRAGREGVARHSASNQPNVVGGERLWIQLIKRQVDTLDVEQVGPESKFILLLPSRSITFLEARDEIQRQMESSNFLSGNTWYYYFPCGRVNNMVEQQLGSIGNFFRNEFQGQRGDGSFGDPLRIDIVCMNE